MTEAAVLIEDRLFSTLDPTTKRLHLPGGETILCSDTVGFVRRLPHQLVEAFRSTLEEVAEADLLVHVVDATAAGALGQIEAVRAVLGGIGAGEIPELVAINKCDEADPEAVGDVLATSGGLAVSARTGEGIEKLVETIGSRLRALAAVIELVVPYERGDVLAALHRDGEVLVEVHAATGTRVRARLDAADVGRFGEFVAGAEERV